MYIFDKQSIIFTSYAYVLVYMKLVKIKFLHISKFMKQNRLAKNETLIWNFIGSL